MDLIYVIKTLCNIHKKGSSEEVLRGTAYLVLFMDLYSATFRNSEYVHLSRYPLGFSMNIVIIYYLNIYHYPLTVRALRCDRYLSTDVSSMANTITEPPTIVRGPRTSPPMITADMAAKIGSPTNIIRSQSLQENTRFRYTTMDISQCPGT